VVPLLLGNEAGIDWLIVQGEAMIPRRGKFADLKIFLWFPLHIVLNPVIDSVLPIRDPGSYFFPSRMRIVSIPDPGSASKNLSILTQKMVSKL
jgi:hypothetical protein